MRLKGKSLFTEPLFFYIILLNYMKPDSFNNVGLPVFFIKVSGLWDKLIGIPVILICVLALLTDTKNKIGDVILIESRCHDVHNFSLPLFEVSGENIFVLADAQRVFNCRFCVTVFLDLRSQYLTEDDILVNDIIGIVFVYHVYAHIDIAAWVIGKEQVLQRERLRLMFSFACIDDIEFWLGAFCLAIAVEQNIVIIEVLIEALCHVHEESQDDVW